MSLLKLLSFFVFFLVISTSISNSASLTESRFKRQVDYVNSTRPCDIWNDNCTTQVSSGFRCINGFCLLQMNNSNNNNNNGNGNGNNGRNSCSASDVYLNMNCGTSQDCQGRYPQSTCTGGSCCSTRSTRLCQTGNDTYIKCNNTNSCQQQFGNNAVCNNWSVCCSNVANTGNDGQTTSSLPGCAQVFSSQTQITNSTCTRSTDCQQYTQSQQVVCFPKNNINVRQCCLNI